MNDVQVVEDRKQEVKALLNNVPKGRAKSGRPWKTNRTERHSTIVKVKSLKSNWDKKMKSKHEQKSIKDFEKRLKEERANKLQMKRQKTEEKKKRKIENERKNEIVQKIKSTAKIKRMKKKQLRLLAKR